MLKGVEDRGMVSVIIPAYNAEKYLARAVRSVLRQTYPDLEILIIDDGSSDQTIHIGKKLELEDVRIKLVKNSHAGPAYSRNMGISIANGQYITFLDADDEYEPDFLYNMLCGITKDKADICICSYMSVYTDHREINACLKSEKYKVCDKEQFIKMLLKGEISSHPWNKIYTKKFISGLRYPEGKYYEDVFMMNDLAQKVELAAIIDYVGIKYYQNSGSIVHKKKDEIEIDAFDAFYERIILFQNEYAEYEGYLLKTPVEIAIRLVIKKMIKGTELDEKRYNSVKSFLKIQKYNKKAYSRLRLKYKLAFFLCG